MKIKNSLFGIIISVLLSVIFISGCGKDNPVIPPPPPPISNDTGSKYNWELINIYPFNFVTGLYVADTNEIYIQAGFYYIIYYNGVSGEYFDFNHPEFTCTRVNGYDKNNVYFGGAIRLSSQKKVPTVKKKTNGIISTYILDTINAAIHDIIVISENIAWLSDTKNVYHFGNGISKRYQICNNDSLYIFKLYYDNSGFYAFVINFDDDIIYTYKFINDNFILIREDCGMPSDPNCVSPYMAICGNDIISFYGSHNLLKQFENDKWSVHSVLDSVSIQPSQVAGWNKDSLIALCYSRNYGGFQLYFYNGQKWRCENIYPLSSIGSVDNFCYEGKVKDGNVYFLYLSDFSSKIYLLVGRPKK
jgi:hypothetical protein